MKTPSLPVLASVLGAWALSGPLGRAADAAAAAPPHLEPRGAATQLIVDGQPYLVLGGEIANTASSSLSYMQTVWPRLARMHLNTVLTGASWALVEPEEGKFDFSGIDALLAGARNNHLHIAFVWFASWKNGLSNFAPAWVKADQDRFPRVQVANGNSIETLSPLGAASQAADARAYGAFMRHLREVDGQTHTVVMIQMENEVGVLGDSRDRSPAAETAFAGPVPDALLSYLQAYAGALKPELLARWDGQGRKTSGSWTQVFGSGPATDEIFMAWHYATYMDAVSAAGKAEYPLPTFTNTWIVQPEDHGPGDYPSGGPEPLVLDVWKAGAPHIDLNCPDIYLPDFKGWVSRFHRPGNPLFVPESRGDVGGVANAFYAIGQHAALGYSPFGIDNTTRLVALRPDLNSTEPTAIDDLPLPRAYALLDQLTPLILAHQASGTIAGASVTAASPTQTVELNGYKLQVEIRRNRRDPSQVAPTGYGMFFALGPDEFLVAGGDISVVFIPTTPGPPIAGFARVEAGTMKAGQWTPDRVLNGDDIILRYDLAAAAAEHQSGSALMFEGANPTLQRVTLYRYH